MKPITWNNKLARWLMAAHFGMDKMRRRVARQLLTLVTGAVVSTGVSAEQLGPPDSATGRLSALAILNGLNAELLSNDSATLTLDRWCAAHHLANPPTIVAQQELGADNVADADVRKLLDVDASEPVKHRRVKLSCGEHVLSEADNWYVPSRLTPEMNNVLETTNTAFGRAVQSLHFQRHTISARLLWQPLPSNWDMGASLPPTTGKPLIVPESLLQHKAFLTRADGKPFSVVVETYTRAVLDFRWPTLEQ